MAEATEVKKESTGKYVPVRLSQEDWELLGKIAKQNGRSRRTQAEYIVLKALKKA